MNNKVELVNIDYYIPAKKIDNKFIATKYGIDEDIIFPACGIKERRYRTDENTSDLAVKAINKLIEKSGLKKNDIEYIIIGTITPEAFAPSTAAIVIEKLGLINANGVDVSAACSGFNNALEIGSFIVSSGRYKNVIVCGVDVFSAALNDYDYKTGILFGDGAGAALLRSTDSDKSYIQKTKSIIKSDNQKDIDYQTKFSLQYSSQLKIQGTKVYQNGVNFTVEFLNAYFFENDLNVQNFDFVILHQANARIITKIANLLNIPSEKCLTNIELLGNTTAASIPICFAQNVEQGIIKKGDRILLCSFGAGYTLSLIDLFY